MSHMFSRSIHTFPSASSVLAFLTAALLSLFAALTPAGRTSTPFTSSSLRLHGTDVDDCPVWLSTFLLLDDTPFLLARPPHHF
ncbi:hypothetical protein YC2023_077952 [Brassica napus]